jgi:predicted phage baseplate assembly protein
MSVALPNLDDRRWADLVEEGRTLIPFYSPEWTDHNVHDPGITLIELFAWLAEMDIYQLNRIPQKHLRKFLPLIGIHPEPPRPALAPLSLSLGNNLSGGLRIPASVEFEGADDFGQISRFRSLSDLYLARAELRAIQLKDQNGFHDLTRAWQRGETIEILGDDPKAGTELYLGFSESLPINIPVSLLCTTLELSDGEMRRSLLVEELETRGERCRLGSFPACSEKENDATAPAASPVQPRFEHHSVRLAWEFHNHQGGWQRLGATSEKEEIIDGTRAFTLNGRIQVELPRAMASEQIGTVKDSYHYLRCRIASGFYDAPPYLHCLAVNGVFVEQAAPAGVLAWTIAPAATVTGKAPKIGNPSRFQLEFNTQGEISRLSFVKDKAAAAFKTLGYRPNTIASPGALIIEAVHIGKGDGKPNLKLKLPSAPALPSGFRLFTIEQGDWLEWSLKEDLDSSGRAAAHFLLDATEGTVSFGDGERGRAVPKNAPVIVSYSTTRAGDGNIAAHRITTLSDTLQNRALLKKDFKDLKDNLGQITNPLPATGGAAAETLSHGIGRAIEAVEKTGRAVTLGDYEALALGAPGAQLARASARANLHPAFPCLNASGIITLMVVPHLPRRRPVPSPGLKQLVAAYLSPRRVIGTRVEVIGPTYVEVTVLARVQALRGVNKANLSLRITTALDSFFDPLTGGPDLTGWPFGRDVFRSEVLQKIDEVAGVDHVLSLGLEANCGEAQCGNLCLRANELVASGQHRIEVV